MMNYVWGLLMVVSVICGTVTGRMGQVSDAVLTGGTQGVELCITLLSMMILWGGLTAIMQQSGLSALLGKGLSPIMKRLFPDLKNQPEARNAIAMNVAANMLGLGNAATPLGLKAMKELSRVNNHSSVASNSMVTFVVLNSVSVQLIPTGLFILRKQFGAANPTDVLPAVWFASITSAAIGVCLALILNRKRCRLYG
ncbi:MAG: spore maturation protein A [Clostridia bacterium]|nr:spore maturation protein A [Clostridia bacterium]